MNNCKVIPVWNMTENEWLAQRRALGIGGSDAGTILGVNTYKSPYALWADKTGRADKDDAGDAARWGHRLEPVIAQAYAEDYNVALVEWKVILVSVEHPYMFANLDYLEVTPSEQFPAGLVTEWRELVPPPGAHNIVECKTSGIASPGTVHHWNNNQIPISYYYQGLHYSIVTGIFGVTFVALLAGQGLVIREMPMIDEDADTLIAAESMFWDLVQSDTPPPVDGSNSTEEAQKFRFREVESGLVYDGGATLAALWADFEAAKAEAEAADKARKELRAKILEAVGNAEVGVAGDQKLFTFKSNNPTVSVDTGKLKSEFPDIYEAVKKTNSGARVLRGASKLQKTT